MFNDNCKYRNSSIELLRLLCMMFIIGHHIITIVISPNFTYPIYTFIDTLLHVAVVVFILISGYFGIRFNLSKLFSLWSQVIYYSVLAAAFGYFILHSVSLKNLILSTMPITRHTYWFMTAYIELYLAAPFINFLLDRMNFRANIALLFVLGFSSCILFNGDMYNAGTNLTSFSFIYVLGRCLKMYPPKLLNSVPFIVIFVLSYVSVVYLFSFLPNTSHLFPYFLKFFYRYNGVAMIMFAICIFSLFNINTFYNKYINGASKSVLAIYLIHENHIISDSVYVKPTEALMNAIPSGGGTRVDGYYDFLCLHSI